MVALYLSTPDIRVDYGGGACRTCYGGTAARCRILLVLLEYAS